MSSSISNRLLIVKAKPLSRNGLKFLSVSLLFEQALVRSSGVSERPQEGDQVLLLFKREPPIRLRRKGCLATVLKVKPGDEGPAIEVPCDLVRSRGWLLGQGSAVRRRALG